VLYASSLLYALPSCPRAAFLARVEGVQQGDDFGAAHFADDEPVGAHPQCLADEFVEFHSAAPFDVGWTRLQSDHVGVVGAELGRDRKSTRLNSSHVK